MLDHVTISVSNIARAIAFYDRALAPLGIERLYAEARQAFEEGRQVNEELSTPSTQGT